MIRVKSSGLMSFMSIGLLATGVPAQESRFMSKTPDAPSSPQARVLLALKPEAGTPRHSEGDLVSLKNGGLLLIWTRFTSGTGGDHDPADLAVRRAKEAADNRAFVPSDLK